MEILEKLFEPQLLAELSKYPVQKIKKGEILIEEYCSVESIPILIKGKIEVSQTNYLNQQTHVYDILPIESCILSLVAGETNKPSVGNGIAKEDSDIILVSPMLTKKWYDSYASWRRFVATLYDKRLNELIHQRNVVQQQTKLIENQKNHITESIRYARRIQKTVLQTPVRFKENVPDSFILNQPKDIVSGDFFWSTKVGDIVLFAVADCTGHGVPGAMLSIVCSKKLAEVVDSNAELSVGEILDEVSRSVQEVFETEEMTLADGMDISLCAFNIDSRQFSFSGANNSIYKVTALDRESKSDKTVENGKRMVVEYKASRQPIGKSEIDTPFETQLINYEQGDVFYLTSDGYADQFGGLKDKKLRKKGMKELFLDIDHLAIDEKQTAMLTAFNEWKGSNEQVDDVLVIGVKMR